MLNLSELLKYVRFLATGLLTVSCFCAPAKAQCSNSITPSCGVYASCFAKYCPCSGADEYFLAYGKPYCEKFLGLTDFSASGVKWRDKTLVCLQEAIVPKLDISNQPKCDCKAMKQHAYVSHVKCYLADPSICGLPGSDKLKILKAAGLGTLITDELSRKQFREVLAECVSSTAGEALEALKTTLTNLGK